jgi:exodeoxyribonuclease-5
VTIQLTEQQQNALDKVAEWANSAGAGDIFRIFGYAGTGKSTIVERLADIVAVSYTHLRAHETLS